MEPCVLETPRLILRPWRDTEADAAALYRYANDERVGPPAGWAPHTDVGYSRTIIRTIFNHARTVFAITRKGAGDEPVGSIGLTVGASRARGRKEDEAEVGYWIGVPFWRQGLMTEALTRVLGYGFSELSLRRVWCAYYEDNAASSALAAKCGFVYDHTDPASFNPMLGEKRAERFTRLDRESFLRQKFSSK